MKKFKLWLWKLLCPHNWTTVIYSKNCYDEEMWNECSYCKKQREYQPLSQSSLVFYKNGLYDE